MENYICQCITPRLSSDHIAKVVAPEGGLTAGQVVIVDTLDNTIVGNIEVFNATKPTTTEEGDNFSVSAKLALVINDGFETMDDGRRPAGQPNYYTEGYHYKEGEVAPVVFLDSHLVFNISEDVLGAATVGQFVYAQANSYDLAVSSTNPEHRCFLKVVAIYNTPVGGNFGGGFAKSYICVAQ